MAVTVEELLVARDACCHVLHAATGLLSHSWNRRQSCPPSSPGDRSSQLPTKFVFHAAELAMPDFDPRTAPAVEVATDWLRRKLAAGPLQSRSIRLAARKAGIAKGAIYRASHRLGVNFHQGRWILR
jgi:hypothetical protein